MQTKHWLSRYRDELKGIAILWVIFFHMAFQSPGALYDIQKIGYGGVDIFFFLTGYGLYHSLHKNHNLKSYWKRRMRRILPAYVPFILCWMLVMFPSYGLGATAFIRSAIGNLFMVGFWLNVPKLFNWYMSALLLFLLLAPLLFSLLSQSQKPSHTLLLLLGLAFLVGLCCIGDDRYMAVSRLPVFILGMAFAMDWNFCLKPMMARLTLLLSFLVGLGVLLLCFSRYEELLNTYAMYWHPFVLITPPLCVFLSFVFHKAEKVKLLFAPLRVLGGASFEIYLFNIWLETLGKKNHLAGFWPWFFASLGCIFVGIAYHWIIQFAEKRLLAS